MSYTVRNVKKFDDWKKSGIRADDMVFPALLTIHVAGNAAVSPIDTLSTPGIVLNGAMALYGKERTENLFANNIKSDGIKNRVNEAMNNITKDDITRSR